MCYNISINRESTSLEKRFGAKYVATPLSGPVYHASGFSTPSLPVITNADSGLIQLFRWGLIPSWVKDETTANTIRLKTLNARSETIFEKPSFKVPIRKKRCLVLVSGFYEWREVNSKKYPYYIQLTDETAFAMAGIWDVWTDRATDETIQTFSIITTTANPLMARIHNTNKRMPVILRNEAEREWLDTNLSDSAIQSFFEPYPQEPMEAYPVSRLITTRGANTNTPEVQKPHEYEELRDQ